MGGQRIDRQYGDWMHIWNQLTLSSEQRRGYQRMVTKQHSLHICDPTFADVKAHGTSAPTQVCAPRNALPETTLCPSPVLVLP